MRSYQPWLDNLNQEPGRVPFAWSNVWHWHNFWPPCFSPPSSRSVLHRRRVGAGYRVDLVDGLDADEFAAHGRGVSFLVAGLSM